jgi:hypothetical protein
LRFRGAFANDLWTSPVTCIIAWIVIGVKSLPIPTPFSRPIATPYRVLVRAYPRHA